MDIFINQLIQFYVNNSINPRLSTPHIMATGHTHGRVWRGRVYWHAVGYVHYWTRVKHFHLQVIPTTWRSYRDDILWRHLTLYIGTALVEYGAGSTRRSGVRQSVCPIVRSQQRREGGFAAERRVGRRYRYNTAASAGRPEAAAPQHGAQRQMRAVPRWQRVDDAEHRLVVYFMISVIVGRTLVRYRPTYRRPLLLLLLLLKKLPCTCSESSYIKSATLLF